MWSISQALEEHFSNFFLSCRGILVILEDFGVFGKSRGF